MRQKVALGEVMYGVVLWSDCVENRAVIWCEDHGDLAFFRGEPDGIMALTAGDLVEFDVRDGGEMRLAGPPRLVSHQSHPTLGQELKKAGAQLGVVPGPSGALSRSAEPTVTDTCISQEQIYPESVSDSVNVISFDQRRMARSA
ncbi:hypothetical protein O4H61_02545 [Roseovarius aestuarii]|nr:hypothetical protein [Roseovarius aestuarii]